MEFPLEQNSLNTLPALTSAFQPRPFTLLTSSWELWLILRFVSVYLRGRSCVPTILMTSVTTTTPARPGRSVTLHSPPLKPLSLQNKLRNWHFECGCSVCGLPDAELRKNDAIRRYWELLEWLTPNSPCQEHLASPWADLRVCRVSGHTRLYCLS